MDNNNDDDECMSVGCLTECFGISIVFYFTAVVTFDICFVCIERSTVRIERVCHPSPGIPVFFHVCVGILNESFDVPVSNIGIVRISISEANMFSVYRYRLELDSDIDIHIINGINNDINHNPCNIAAATTSFRKQ